MHARLALFALLLFIGCARPATTAPAPVASSPRDGVAGSLRAQLAGHLDRAQGCFTEARLRDPDASGLVRYAFTIRSDGRVADVDVDAWSGDSRMLGACVRSRMSYLYFDPAPPRDVRIERTFYVCPDEDDGLCQLGLVGGDDELMQRVARGLDARTEALEACARTVGADDAILDVRLELGPDGRIMAGQLHRAAPEGTPMARCAVSPLLGAQVTGPAPSETVQLRYVYRLGARGDQG